MLQGGTQRLLKYGVCKASAVVQQRQIRRGKPSNFHTMMPRMEVPCFTFSSPNHNLSPHRSAQSQGLPGPWMSFLLAVLSHIFAGHFHPPKKNQDIQGPGRVQGLGVYAFWLESLGLNPKSRIPRPRDQAQTNASSYVKAHGNGMGALTAGHINTCAARHDQLEYFRKRKSLFRIPECSSSFGGTGPTIFWKP